VGLLNGSFRPEQDICVVRALLRHRDSLVRVGASHVQQMQKALNQMNVQIHHVISDLTGQTGLAIVDAILAGQRDAQQLAQLRDRRIKASQETIAKSLVGDYRPEQLFTLKQALSCYRHGQQMIAECDQEISQYLVQLEALCEPLPAEPALAKPAKRGPGRPRGSHTAGAKLRRQLHRIFGVDLTEVPGFNVTTVLTLFTEVGPDLSQFRCAPALASWLGLCPGNKVSGGKILDAKTRRVQSRAAEAFRMAAFSLHGSHSCLGSFYRRLRAKLGAPKAITAAAHKLARIFFHLVTTKQPYDASVFAQHEAAHRSRREQRLQAEARACGYQLTPLAATAE
jgi:hypothetical protein